MAVATCARLLGQRGRQLAQSEEADEYHHEDGEAGQAEDAAPRGSFVLDHVCQEGQCDAGRYEDGRACGEVLEVLETAAQHADSEGQQQRGSYDDEHPRQGRLVPGEDEFVEDCGGEEDQDSVPGDAGVTGGVEWVVDHGAADQSGPDEVANVAEVSRKQGALP
ncbi:hypothetical protein ACH5AG_03165 [Streptomyces anulatus]